MQHWHWVPLLLLAGITLSHIVSDSPSIGLQASVDQETATFTFEKLKVAMVFALELKLSKTLRGRVYFVLQLQGGLRPLYK